MSNINRDIVLQKTQYEVVHHGSTHHGLFSLDSSISDRHLHWLFQYTGMKTRWKKPWYVLLRWMTSYLHIVFQNSINISATTGCKN